MPSNWCSFHVLCCMSRVACCMLHAACCMLHIVCLALYRALDGATLEVFVHEARTGCNNHHILRHVLQYMSQHSSATCLLQQVIACRSFR